MADNSRKKILVVDDTEGTRYSVVRSLTKAGYGITEAVTGAEALRHAAANPDLIILDIRLPDINGYEVCRRLKENPQTAAIPVLHLSASFAEPENRVLGLEGGADGYLVHPIEPRELVANVEALFRVRKAERDALLQKQMLEVTLNSIGDAVIATDLEGKITFLNPVAESLTGWKQAEALDRPVKDVFHIVNEITGEPGEMPVQRVLREGEVAGLANHTRLISRNGSHCSIDDSAAPIRDATGEILGVVMVFRDVTQRRRSEIALRESESKFRGIIETSVIGFAFWHQDGRLLDANDAFLELVGHSRAELEAPGIDWKEVIPPESREQEQHVTTELTSAGKYAPFETEIVRPDGVRVPVLTGGALLAGYRDRGVAYVVDLTASKAAERKIADLLETERRQSERLRRLAQASAGINAAGGLDSVMRVIAEESRQILGAHQSVSSVSADNGAGQIIRAVSLSDAYADWRGSDAELQNAEFHALVSQTTVPLRLTQNQLEAHPEWKRMGAITRKGRPIKGVIATPLIGRGGRKLGAIQLSDKAEGEFDESDDIVLEQLARVAAVAIENARLLDTLRETDRLKDEFLAMLGHELRNPLAPILNSLQVLVLKDLDDPQVRWAMEVANRQTRQLVRLVDDLLDVSRISQGKIKLQKEPTDLSMVIGRAVETSRPLIDSRRHTLEVSIPANAIRVNADQIRLAQVLLNLLNNSAKYTPDGGKIWLTVESQLELVVIRVRDNGIGIAPEMLPRLFDLFAQVERSLDRTEGGLGIGLTLVRRLTEMHGGTVEAFSEGAGKGSEFVVRLPIYVDTNLVPYDPDTPIPLSPPDPKHRFLIVDDNRDSAESLATLLRLMGHQADTEHDGKIALVAAIAKLPDVVVLDIGLPGLNGYEVARMMRQHPELKNATLVAMTGYGSDEDRKRSKEAGFHGHLVKPVDLEDLKSLLNAPVVQLEKNL